jgi:hypothetical protein
LLVAQPPRIPDVDKTADGLKRMRTSTTNPALSVAMSVYNGGPYLAAAIESILAQTFGHFEFLILDDGSTDHSRQVAEAYAARDARIRVIARENRGLVASLNQLLSEARSSLIARMDADDTCLPDRFARQMAFLAANPDHGVIGSDCTSIAADGSELPPARLTRPTSHAQILANLEAGPTMLHNAVIYGRDLVRDIGGYRPAYAHAEDYDLWLRLSQVTRLANLPEPLVTYRLYPGSVSSRNLYAQTRNAAIAWEAHRLRCAGLADPTYGLDQLPADDAGLDALLGPGTAAAVRRRVIDRNLYATPMLIADGWPALRAHAGQNRADRRLWKLAGRMLTAGHPLRAGQLGMALMRA